MRGSHVVLVVLAACGGSRYRTELVGHGNGMVSSRVVMGSTDVVAAPGAGGIQLPQGNYELALRFDVPRAQIVDWKLVCPGVDVDGQVGETFEQYRERRIAELRREAETRRARAQTATDLVVGAITPRVRAGNVQAEAHVHVEVPAEAVVLAPGDVGRGTLVANARVMTAGDGVCTLQVHADDPDVRAAFTVTRIRDLDAEQRMRTIAAREAAVKVRGQLGAQLVAAGADPAIRRARLEADAARAAAEARARLEAQAAAEARVRARAELRARLETTALDARAEYLFYLRGKCNAEPGRRERIAEQERIRREARLVADAELAQRRDQLALRVRADLRARLLALGAKERPPMPAPRPETPGAPPFEGATWTAGSWSWVGGEWAWHDGGWTDPSVFGEAGGDVTVGVSIGVGGSRTYQTGTRDHRRERVNDHRDASPPAWDAGARSRGSSSSSTPSHTRDHRSESRSTWTPRDADSGSTVRDHRKKDDDKKDDDKPRVRDHR